MTCIICNTETAHYFSKEYAEPPFDAFMREIGPVDYHRCPRCGFVQSKTHRELAADQWVRLNHQFHHYLEGPGGENKCNQPPYLEQAAMISLFADAGLISTASMVDYGAGYGTLSRILSKLFLIELPVFDPYIQVEDLRYIGEGDLGRYKTVINSAMFEHVLEREDLDRVNALVSDDGCLIVHTVVCERVPPDPNWFYLRPPVHTAFHTNKSMQALMDQWGYEASLYCPQSKCWVLLKQALADGDAPVRRLNAFLRTDWAHYKRGFLDYWKGF